MPFADRLARLMKLRHRSQGDIAGIVGVSQAAVGKWVRGETDPRTDHATIVARFLDVPIDYLVDDSLGEISPEGADLARDVFRTIWMIGLAESYTRLVINPTMKEKKASPPKGSPPSVSGENTLGTLVTPDQFEERRHGIPRRGSNRKDQNSQANG